MSLTSTAVVVNSTDLHGEVIASADDNFRVQSYAPHQVLVGPATRRWLRNFSPRAGAAACFANDRSCRHLDLFIGRRRCGPSL